MKNSPKQTTRHHRKSVYAGGKTIKSNLSYVTRERHESFHLLFDHGDPYYVAQQLNEIWIDPDYVLIVEKRINIKRR